MSDDTSRRWWEPHLQKARRDFEAAWRSGHEPDLRTYLPESLGSDRPLLLRELLSIELKYRLQRGERPRPDGYLARLPDMQQTVVEVFRACGLAAAVLDDTSRNEQTLPASRPIADLDDATHSSDSVVKKETVAMDRGEQHPAHADSLHHTGLLQDRPTAQDHVIKPSAAPTQAADTLGPGPGDDTIDAAESGEFPWEFGPYVLLEVIAKGGMGVVFKARETKLDRIVAVKMIRAGMMDQQQELARFHAEAQAAAGLQHPNIVPVFEVGEVNRRHYYSMEYVQGRSLDQAIAGGQPLSNQQAARYVADVAKAISFAHQRGVLHRDIKPANVIIDENGRPRVTDFGIAKRLGANVHHTATGQILGTPSYMPPEQAQGDRQRIGRRSDVYSLGALLYALITGRPPFEEDTVGKTLMAVVTTDPVPPSRWNSQVDPDLETICLKCLEKERSDRYSTATAFAADLLRYIAGDPINAKPYSAYEKAMRWYRRNRLTASLAAALVLALVCSIVAFSMLLLRPDQRRVALPKAGVSQQEEADFQRYVTHLRRAEFAARSGDQREARQMIRNLESQDSPSWEERYLLGRIESRFTAVESEAAMTTLTYSPGGRQIMAATDSRLLLFRADQVQQFQPLREATGVTALAMAAGSERIAAGYDSGEVQLLSTTVQEEEEEAFVVLGRLAGEIRHLTFSPDGQVLLAMTSEGKASLLRPARQAVIALSGYQEAEDHRQFVSFEPQGKRCCIGTAGGFAIYDCDSGELVKQVPCQVDFLKPNALGNRLYAVRRKGEFQAFDTYDGSLKGRAPYPKDVVFKFGGSKIRDIAWHPEEDVVFLEQHGVAARVIGMKSKRELCTLQVAPSFTHAFRPDGRVLAVSGGSGGVQFCSLDRPRPARTIRPLGASQVDLSRDDIAFSHDGQRIFARAQPGAAVQIFGVQTGEALRITTEFDVRVFAASPQGKYLAAATESALQIWDVGANRWIEGDQSDASGPALVSECGYTPKPSVIEPGAVVWSRDARYIAVASNRGVHVFRGSQFSFERFHFVERSTWMQPFQWMNQPPGQPPLRSLLVREAGGDEEHPMLNAIWEPRDRNRALSSAWENAHAALVPAIAASEDGRWLAVSSGSRQVRQFDTNTPGLSISLDAVYPVTALCYSSDKHRLFVARSNGTILLLNTRLAKPIFELTTDIQQIAHLHFDAVSSSLLAVGRSGEIQVFETSSPTTRWDWVFPR